MASTVEEGFREFLTGLTPTAKETEAAASHRASIKACLDTNLGVTHFFRTGSFGNGTSISGYSDVDYFAGIPTEKLKRSSTNSLSMVRDALNTRFPNTGVRVSCPAVTVPFGTNKEETTEVVPADYKRTTKEGYRVFDIADCAGGWIEASPDAHNAYVRDVDAKRAGKVKALVRFLKAWKYYCQVPISSFYLELRVAKYASGEDSIVYPIAVKNVFKLLSDNALAKMQDPQGISGYISPCSTQAKLDEATSKLKTALTRADKAETARLDGKVRDAFSWWSLAFNGHFSEYTG